MDKNTARSTAEQFLRNQIKKIARDLVGVEKRINVIERASQSKFRSVSGGSTVYYDQNGEVRQVIGEQEDGSYTVVDYNAPPMAVPSAPIVEPREGTLTITWNGLIANGSAMWPSDFSHVEVHLSTQQAFAVSDATELASFHSRVGGSLTQALEPETEYYVKLVSVNTSGTRSEASLEVSAIVLAFVTGIQTYRGPNPPAGLGLDDEGALWIDTDDDNRQYYWDGTDWIDIQPTAIDAAVESALEALDNAQSKVKLDYSTAQPTGLTADDRVLWMDPNNGYAAQYWNGVSWSAYFFGPEAVGFDARDIGGILTAAGITAPSNPQIGDIWFNANENNRPERWDGVQWVPLRDTEIATASANASQAIADAAAALTAAETAQATADGSIRTYYASTPPWPDGSSQPDSVLGDMWFDQDDGQAYRWNGTSWQIIEDSSIAVALAAAQNAQTTADGKITAYYQDTQPVVGEIGDLWYDTNDQNKPYYCSSISPLTWTLVRDQGIVAAQATADQAIADAFDAQTSADGKASTYFQNDPPWANGTTGHALDNNDIWVDINDGNKLYRWNDSTKTWTLSQDTGIVQALLEAEKLASQGTDLVINGAGSMGNNTNFSSFTYDAADAPPGAKASFNSALGIYQVLMLDQMISVDPNKKYMLSFMGKQKGANTNSPTLYSFLAPYDAYNNSITPAYYTYTAGTLTTLAAQLNPGDTTITLTNSANWYGTSGKPAGVNTHFRSIIWWDYTDPGGKLWPENTYSRNYSGANYYADGGITGNIITLNAPYSGPIRAVGTKLSNGSSGGTYMYGGAAASSVPTTWTRYAASIQGLSSGGAVASFTTGFPPGTALAKLGFLANYTTANAPGSQHSVALVSLSDAAAAQETAEKKITTFYQTNPPVSTAIGDLWVDTDADNKLYRAASVGADAITAGEWVAVAFGLSALASNVTARALGAITTYSGATDPAAQAIAGDLWLKPETSEGVGVNVLYRRNDTDTAWVRVDDPAAQQAIADAQAAAALADGKMAIYPQAAAPTGLTVADNGDLWIDTDDGNKTYRYVHGSTAGTNGAGGAGPWISILDTSLASIQYVDQQILTSANGKNKSTYSTGVPGTTANIAGDIWFQYNASNQIIGQWRGTGGTSWTPVTLENSVIATIDAGKINTGFLDVANRIQAGSLTIGQVQSLQAALDAKTKTFAQASIPTSVAAGDIWIDTDDANKMYRAFAANVNTIGSSAWVLINDPTAKTTTFAQAAVPVSTAAGDIWVDTDDSNKMYRAIIRGADAITAGEWVLINNPSAASKTFAQAAVPVSLSIGDIWVDTDDSNKMYVARSVGADAIVAGEWELFNDLTTKTKTFAQAAIPTAVTAGDMWVDTDDNNKLYRAFAAGVNTIGAAGWVLVQDAVGQASTARTNAVNDIKTLWGHASNTTLIDGGDIFTNTIRAKSLLLTDINNYLSDPGMTDTTSNSWTLSTGSSVVASSGTTPGYLLMNVPVASSNSHSGDAAFWATEPETQYVVSGEVWAEIANTGPITFTSALRVLDNSNATIGFPGGAGIVVSEGVWTPFEHTIIIPANGAKFHYYPYVNSATINDKVRLRNIKVRRKSGGELIVDGAIDGKTITGALIQTAEEADRGIKLDRTALTAHNSSGEETLSIDAVEGAITLKGNITAGSTITGATFRTDLPGTRRIVIDSAGLTQYDANDVPIIEIGDSNRFTGSIVAEDIIVHDGLELFGKNNTFKTGSEIVLATGQGGSAQAPSLSNFYEVSPADISTAHLATLGLFTDATESLIYRTTGLFGSCQLWKGATDWHYPMITRSDSTTHGEFAVLNNCYTRIKHSGGERAVVAGYRHSNGEIPGTYDTPLDIRIYNDSAMTSSVAPTMIPFPVSFQYATGFQWSRSMAFGKLWGESTWGSQFCTAEMNNPGTGATPVVRMTVQSVESDTVRTQTVDTGWVVFPMVHNTEKIVGVAYGRLDAMKFLPAGHPQAGAVVWVLMTTHQNVIWAFNNLSPTGRYTGLEWPVTPTAQDYATTTGNLNDSASGFGRFVNWKFGGNTDAANEQKLVRYSNETWDSNVPGTNDPVWAQFAWKGHSTKTSPEALTTPSPLSVALVPLKRARRMVSVPALPTPIDGQNSPRDPDKDIYSWVYYVGKKATEPLRTEMWRQLNTPTGEPTNIQSLVLPESLTTSGTNPLVSTQGFATLTPAKIVSSTGGYYIDGDGNINAKNLEADALVVVGRDFGDTDWINMPMVGAWVAYDARVPQYRKVNGVVYFRGIIKNGSGQFTTMPAGFRPGDQLGGLTPYQHHWPIVSAMAFGVARGGPDGQFDISAGANSWCDLDGVSYIAVL